MANDVDGCIHEIRLLLDHEKHDRAIAGLTEDGPVKVSNFRGQPHNVLKVLAFFSAERQSRIRQTSDFRSDMTAFSCLILFQSSLILKISRQETRRGFQKVEALGK